MILPFGPDAIKAISNISTAINLLAFFALVYLVIEIQRIRSDEKKLRSVPEKERARLLDNSLTRYKIYGTNLSSEQKFKLISKELDAKSRTTTKYLIVVLAAFVLALGTKDYFDSRVIPGDLTPTFGFSKELNTGRVRHVPRSENTKLIRARFEQATSGVKIVTKNGSSWIRPDLMQTFREVSSRIPVDLMLLDFTDKQSALSFNEAMTAFGDSIWTQEDYTQNISAYTSLLGNGSKLTLGLYREYPWDSFTIFDDKAVSFVITPVVAAPHDIIAYYSEDPFVVRCFEIQFEKLQQNATHDGRIFRDAETAKQYLANHQFAGTGNEF